MGDLTGSNNTFELTFSCCHTHSMPLYTSYRIIKKEHKMKDKPIEHNMLQDA